MAGAHEVIGVWGETGDGSWTEARRTGRVTCSTTVARDDVRKAVGMSLACHISDNDLMAWSSHPIRDAVALVQTTHQQDHLLSDSDTPWERR